MNEIKFKISAPRCNGEESTSEISEWQPCLETTQPIDLNVDTDELRGASECACMYTCAGSLASASETK